MNFGQEDMYTSAERATTKTSQYVETSTSTANLFANESVNAFAKNNTNLVSTDLAVVVGRDINARVGRSTSFVTKHTRIASEMGVDLDAKIGSKSGLCHQMHIIYNKLVWCLLFCVSPSAFSLESRFAYGFLLFCCFPHGFWFETGGSEET